MYGSYTEVVFCITCKRKAYIHEWCGMYTIECGCYRPEEYATIREAINKVNDDNEVSRWERLP